MYIVSRVFLWLGLIGLAITLAVPNFDRAMSWREATPGVFAGLFFSVLFGILCVVFAPKKLKDDAPARSAWRRRAGIYYSAIGLVVCFGLGGMTLYLCQDKLSHRSYSSPSYGYGGGYKARSSYEVDYSGEDQYGRDLGVISVGAGLIPLVGLILALTRKPKTA